MHSLTCVSVVVCVVRKPRPCLSYSRLKELKEEKWGSHKQSLLAELERMSGEGWVVVYTDGLAKRVRGWMQAGYGVWFGDNSSRNFRAHVPAHERQSISRGGVAGGATCDAQSDGGGADGGGGGFRVNL